MHDKPKRQRQDIEGFDEDKAQKENSKNCTCSNQNKSCFLCGEPSDGLHEISVNLFDVVDPEKLVTAMKKQLSISDGKQKKESIQIERKIFASSSVQNLHSNNPVQNSSAVKKSPLNECPSLIVQPSSKNVYVELNYPGTNENSMYRFKLINLETNEIQIKGPIQQNYWGFDGLESGCNYNVVGILKNPYSDKHPAGTLGKCFKTTFSKDEQRKLMNKAIELNMLIGKKYWKPEMEQIKYFQRYAFNNIWEEVKENNNSIIRKVLQRFDGHPACAIVSENRVKGVWFGTKLFRHMLPTKSAFGNERFLVECHNLFKPNEINLYFADFYCKKGEEENHCVDLVMCKKNSKEDEFCKIHLIQLENLSTNNLLTVEQNDGQLLFFTMTSVHVNVFYTEEVPLSLGFFDGAEIEYQGRGYGYTGSCYCPECEYCNLFESGDEKDERDNEPGPSNSIRVNNTF